MYFWIVKGFSLTVLRTRVEEFIEPEQKKREFNKKSKVKLMVTQKMGPIVGGERIDGKTIE